MKKTFLFKILLLSFIVLHCSSKEENNSGKETVTEKKSVIKTKIDLIYKYYYGKPSSIGDTLSIEIYDMNGKIYSSKDYKYYPEGRYLENTTVYKYDTLERKIFGTRKFSKRYKSIWSIPNNAYSTFSYNYPNKDTAIEFESRFNRYRGDNARFYRSFINQYDIRNRKIQEIEYNSYTQTIEKVVKFSYDNENRIIESNTYDQYGSIKVIQRYTYDNLSRILELNESFNDNSKNIIKSYYYNEEGLIDKIIVKNYMSEPLYLIKSYYSYYSDISTNNSNLSDTVIISPKEKEYSFAKVKIGKLVWMAENLDVEYYRNGDPIPHVKDKDEWASLKTGAWCYYDNDPENGKKYGKLYNWYAVTDYRGLAPEGWHIPTNDEFITLIQEVKDDGKALKGLGKGSDSGIGTNTSGFSALLAGYRNYDGRFSGLESLADFLSSSQYDRDIAYSLLLQGHDSIIYLNHYPANDGSSVRCVKD